MKLFHWIKKLFKWALYFLLLCLFGLIILFFVVTSPEDKPIDDPKIVNDVTQLNPIEVAEIKRPKSVQEIATLVKQHNGPISIGGGRYSMGGQTASHQALQLDLRQFNQVISFSKEKKEITVEPGITWRQIQDYIDPYNLSLKVMQTYSNFTVGGSLSVNVHGRYLGLGPVIYTVKSIKLVLADGQIITASPTENSELFYGAIGGYGALGVIVEATLSLDDNVKVERITKKMSIDEYQSFFFKNIRQDTSIVFHNADIYPGTYNEITSVSYVKTNKALTIEDRLRPKDKNYRLEKFAMWIVSETPCGGWIRKNILDPVFNSDGEVEWRNYEASYNVKELEPSSRATSTYVLQEYFVPVDKINQFTPGMREIFQRHKPNIINVSIRHAHKDPGSLMAWAKTEVFAFVVYYKQGTSEADKQTVAVWTRELIELAASLGGAYYLPYQIHATDEQFRKCYPNADLFFALKRKVDPQHKFRNKLWDAYHKPDTLTKAEKDTSTSRFKLLLTSVGKNDSMFLFLQNVYGLYPTGKYLELIKAHAMKYATDKEIYENIQKGLPDIKPALWAFRYALPALSKQKNEIADQTIALIGKEKPINGYLEIGTTGRYVNVIEDRVAMEGPVYLSYYEHPSYGPQDIMERGQLSKIGTFFDLNNYDPISTASIPDTSLDLITIYIGLHHCPLNKMDAYVKSLYRVLRPDGKLVIRDHNVTNKTFGNFVSLIHDVFYCGLEETWQYTSGEIRNFTASDSLQQYLQARGFKGGDQRLLQAHDPSLNTLMCFTRLPETGIAAELSQIKGWKRDEGQTYLTLPEWYLVYSPDEYAQFISKEKPSKFPYYGASKQFWDYYSDVCHLTEKQYAFNQGYHLMLWVIGSSYSLENLVKGMYEKTIGRISELFSWGERTEEDEYAAKIARDYVAFIRIDPWYEFPFGQALWDLWTGTDLFGKGMVRKCERKIILSNEYAVKALYAYLIKLGTKEVYGDAESEMFVRTKGINDSILKEHPKISFVKTLSDSTQIITLPRYEQFRDESIALFDQTIPYLQVAGNDTILLSYVAPDNKPYTFSSGEVVIKRPVLTLPGYNRSGLKVPVIHLDESVRYLQKEGLVIEHIYDY
ncbi:MAG: FAD-binding protein [Chitinophagaceae bacterium]|nr:FAD-binding protein [Chitinophagaceae bacterium]